MKDVLIIMGSDSDLPVMKEAAMVLDALNITPCFQGQALLKVPVPQEIS